MDSEELVDIADAVFGLVDIVAKSLGYEYVALRQCGQSCRSYACVLRCSGCAEYLKTKTADGQLETLELDMPSCNGKSLLPMYCDFARELYRILDNGEAVYAKDKKLDASMVPEFMMQCVLNGIS